MKRFDTPLKGRRFLPTARLLRVDFCLTERIMDGPRATGLSSPLSSDVMEAQLIWFSRRPVSFRFAATPLMNTFLLSSRSTSSKSVINDNGKINMVLFFKNNNGNLGVFFKQFTGLEQHGRMTENTLNPFVSLYLC